MGILLCNALSQKIRALPDTPGCYIYLSADREVLYVGKSKCIRKRVAQYFQRTEAQPPKIQKMVRMIADMRYILVETEIEALLLEHRLIKTYRPPFNAQMKKDRTPPYIGIDRQKTYPGLEILLGSPDERNGKEAKQYFGHFPHLDAAYGALTLINAVWRTPLCGRAQFDQAAERPCLNYHIGKCAAPCAHLITPEAYGKVIGEVCAFLSGKKTKPALSALKREMQQAAESLAFEKAGRLRDQYNGLSGLAKRMKRVYSGYAGKRICVFLKGFHEDAFLLCYIVDGKLRLMARFESKDQWPDGGANGGLAAFINRIITKQADAELFNGLSLNPAESSSNERVRLCAAIRDVQARKRFIDITHIRKDTRIRVLLLKEFPLFYAHRRRLSKKDLSMRS